MMNLNIEKKQIDLISESICVHTIYGQCMELHRRGALSFPRGGGVCG